MEIADSARKHGISDEDILHAVRLAIREVTNPDGPGVLLIGPDTIGRFLEIVVIDPDGDPAVIHADVLRPKFYPYL
jgi:hypothetical protein